ncbi:MAG: oligoendopeptidase F, partial [Sporosarcina sp.]
MVKSMPLRSEVKTEETWNLQDLFKTEEEYNTAIIDLEKEVDTFAEKFSGNITDATSVNAALKSYASIYENMVPIGTYTSLSSSTDQTDDEAQMRSGKFGSTAAKLTSKLSFLNSELAELPAETLVEAMQQSNEFKNYLEKLIRKKKYQLHPEVEKTLAAYSSTFNAPYGLY